MKYPDGTEKIRGVAHHARTGAPFYYYDHLYPFSCGSGPQCDARPWRPVESAGPTCPLEPFFWYLALSVAGLMAVVNILE